MTDRYENIRLALALLDSGDYCERAIGYSKLRNACRPDTIRELLAERDRLAAALEAAHADRDVMREALKDADNELDLIDEEMDTCDHSVGVCTCSYWGMRRKMKAALAKENRNG